MQIVALLYHRRYLGILLWYRLWHHHLKFHVFIVHLVALQCLDVLWIVRIIVDGRHSAQLVESPGEHSLWVHVGEAQWPHHILHALSLAIVFYGLHQGLGNLAVVDKVDPSEAYGFAAPLIVGLMIDNGSDASCYLAVLIGKIVLCFTKVESCVSVLAQSIHIVAKEIRHVILVAFVEVVMEVDERLQVLLVFDLFNFY